MTMLATAIPAPSAPLKPFDFTSAMRLLCEDICDRLEEFEHIKMEQVAVTFAQARRRVKYGLQAKLTPLRFEGGELVTRRRGKMWTIQRWCAGDIEQLYILTYYLPRFLEQSFREKLITVMHELYHISPSFDGDIRRLPGHYHVHSHSKRAFDKQMEVLVDRYLRTNPTDELLHFLQASFRDLAACHGTIVGIKVPIPKLIPIKKPKTPRPKA